MVVVMGGGSIDVGRVVESWARGIEIAGLEEGGRGFWGPGCG